LELRLLVMATVDAAGTDIQPPLLEVVDTD
jgi:hypothetical protein